MKTEPVRTAILAVIVAACALLVAFGVHLTDTQIVALSGFAGAVLGLFEVVRGHVTPTSSGR